MITVSLFSISYHILINRLCYKHLKFPHPHPHPLQEIWLNSPGPHSNYILIPQKALRSRCLM